MSSALGWINTGINAANAVGSFIGSGSGSSSAVDMQRGMMDHQFELNQYSDWLNYQRTKEMADTQFERNKWFTQHQFRNAFDDLKAAGVNPLLGLPNGSSGSVGMPSVSGSSVGLLDPSSAVTADTNKSRLALDTMLGVANTIADVKLKDSASAKATEEAKSELNKRANIDADTNLKKLQSFGESIKNSYLPDSIKADIQQKINTAKAVLINAEVNKMVAPSQILANKSSAVSAYAAQKNAEASYINATQGNMWKTGVDAGKNVGLPILRNIYYQLDKNSGGKLSLIKKGIYK